MALQGATYIPAADIVRTAGTMAVDDVVGMYRGRTAVVRGDKSSGDVGLDVYEPSMYAAQGSTQTSAKSQQKQAAQKKADVLRSMLSRQFAELQGSGNFQRLMGLLRRMQRQNDFSELHDELERLYPDLSTRFAVVDGLGRMMGDGGEGGGGGGDHNAEASLARHLKEYGEELFANHEKEIVAGQNISGVVNDFSDRRPEIAHPLRDFYRQAVFEFTNPRDAYGFIVEKYPGDGSKTADGLDKPVVRDGPALEQNLDRALKFLLDGLAADLAATKSSTDPNQLKEVMDGMYQVQFLGNSHRSCRELLEKFNASTQESVPVVPYRLLSTVLDKARQEGMAQGEFMRLARDLNVPPFEPSINFMTQLREVVRMIPTRIFETPEKRERLLDTMQKAIDEMIDEEEVALG